MHEQLRMGDIVTETCTYSVSKTEIIHPDPARNLSSAWATLQQSWLESSLGQLVVHCVRHPRDFENLSGYLVHQLKCCHFLPTRFPPFAQVP